METLNILNNGMLLGALLRIGGTIYIRRLALWTARASYEFKETGQPPMAFKMGGVLLQALNPKVVVYGLTLYSSFLAAADSNLVVLAISATLFTFTTFCENSKWALGGSFVKRHLHNPKIRASVNFALVRLLIYTAADLSGVFN
jgi:cysteine/O-acetylserine efflux protein